MSGDPDAVQGCLEYAYYGKSTNETDKSKLLFYLSVASQARHWEMHELESAHCDFDRLVADLGPDDMPDLATALETACKPPYQPNGFAWFDVESPVVCDLYRAAASRGYELFQIPEIIEILMIHGGAPAAHLAKHLGEILRSTHQFWTGDNTPTAHGPINMIQGTPAYHGYGMGGGLPLGGFISPHAPEVWVPHWMND